MNQQVLNKVLRRRIIWAEIKSNEQEYKRLCGQIKELEEAKGNLSFMVQKRLAESQEISEWLAEKEIEHSHA